MRWTFHIVGAWDIFSIDSFEDVAHESEIDVLIFHCLNCEEWVEFDDETVRVLLVMVVEGGDSLCENIAF